MLTPDFSRVLGSVAGLRPFRAGGVRLERVGRVIHNYGHGGAGITLAPGSAILAADLVPAGSTVAVLGAGIIGLSTAAELVSRGHQVTVYARDFPPSTTSAVGGGVWAPIEVGDSPLLPRMLQLSWDFYRACPQAIWHPLYFTPGGVEPLPPQIAPLRPVGDLLMTETYLIPGTVYLRALLAQLTGVEMVAREFSDEPDLPEEVLVNCLGAGAFDDSVVAIRGQLVKLAPLGECYTLIHEDGYVISRPDVCLLGGTFEHGVSDPTPDEAMCAEILERNRRYFFK